jgi:hypothetical protein
MKLLAARRTPTEQRAKATITRALITPDREVGFFRVLKFFMAKIVNRLQGGL